MGRCHVLVHSLQTPFIHILQKWPVAELVCEYLPHSMSNNKMSTCLRLRAASYATLRPISARMGFRIVLLKKHRLAEVRRAAQKLMGSGIMFQLLYCGGKPRPGLLIMDPQTGIPKGMAGQYLEQRQRQTMISGGSADGTLQL